jgi:hypothetical protein
MDEQVALLRPDHRIQALVDRLDRSRGRGDVDPRGVVERVADDAQHLLRHRRREEQRLPDRREQREDTLHVGPEALVEHAVGLVEDEDLHSAQIDVSLTGQVQQAAGGGHEQVDPVLECAALRLVAHAAVDDSDAVARGARGGLRHLFDLQSELAGRGDDERGYAAAARLDALQHRQDERRGLAGAGLRATDDVAPRQDERDGAGLDGGRLVVAHRRDGLHQARVKTQIVETQMKFSFVARLIGGARGRRDSIPSANRR